MTDMDFVSTQVACQHQTKDGKSVKELAGVGTSINSRLHSSTPKKANEKRMRE
jgi:hypothetical protein